MKSIQENYEELLKPSAALVSDMARLEGDVMVLGAGGKMGPALCILAKQAIEESDVGRKLIAVSRFSDRAVKESMERAGIETIDCDLLEEDQLASLPKVKQVLYLAGTKFGTSGRESFTWAMNAYLPGRVAQHFRDSNIVAFSTGNVYPLSRVALGGMTEDRLPEPIGEYAQSCLGRERIFQYYSSLYETPLLLFRLNYANDVRYGVLLEIAKSVFAGKEIDLSMGHVNVIWQGDANEAALRSLHHCMVPARILNITGPETVSVRWLAAEFGKRLGREAKLLNEEQSTALLSNAAASYQLFGYPRVSLLTMIDLISEWVLHGGQTIDKPTHFQERRGQF